jgi:hypothetical protein
MWAVPPRTTRAKTTAGATKVIAFGRARNAFSAMPTSQSSPPAACIEAVAVMTHRIMPSTVRGGTPGGSPKP